MPRLCWHAYGVFARDTTSRHHTLAGPWSRLGAVPVEESAASGSRRASRLTEVGTNPVAPALIDRTGGSIAEVVPLDRLARDCNDPELAFDVVVGHPALVAGPSLDVGYGEQRTMTDDRIADIRGMGRGPAYQSSKTPRRSDTAATRSGSIVRRNHLAFQAAKQLWVINECLALRDRPKQDVLEW